MDQYVIPKDLFALQVTDDSMLSFGIHSGDLVLINPTLSAAQPGQLILTSDGDGGLAVSRWRPDNHVKPSDLFLTTCSVRNPFSGVVWGVWRNP
jgi:hypothetical protein